MKIRLWAIPTRVGSSSSACPTIDSAVDCWTSPAGSDGFCGQRLFLHAHILGRTTGKSV
ncbi:hypothetical protein [Desulfosporosinus lacus]|uniref:hypothetical protein n=1 Tax=Desulfosporosinus lacus TaxID=329936 RepID=UPI00135646C4|nr:hypothetical protein [Desulfosporosinus lacus]